MASAKKRPLSDLSLAEWAASSQSGKSAKLLSEIDATAKSGAPLNAFITTCHDSARAQAAASDERLKAGQARKLEGAAIGVKDNFCTAGIRTTAGSNILRSFTPTYESHVTQKLLDAGAVFVGKTNMDEFGMGSSTEFSAFGPTLNPLGVASGANDVSPGGSSGGSAAAVAAKLCIAALGTDTGGSIRQPASFCGVVGFKPTYGVCSRWGVIAYASSLDQAGVICRSVDDAAMVMDVIAGHDPRDSTSLAGPAPDFLSRISADMSGARIAIPRGMREKELSSDLRDLWTEIERRAAKVGAKIEYVDIATLDASLPAYYIIALSEASSNLARYDGIRYGSHSEARGNLTDFYEKSRSEGFGDEVKRRILLGTFALSAGYYDQYYVRASKVRSKLTAELRDLFARVDFLVWPTAPTPAFKLGAHGADPVSMYLEDAFTVPINLAGLPAISIPGITTANGLSMGFQVIGKQGGDADVLGLARALEQATQA